ncbi:MAG: sigma 54-interacting transcriptional regulator [Candidatus Brocadiia bacterium]
MPPSDNVALITYNGLDGACAAASLLLRYPEAEIYVTSAARVGEQFAALANVPLPPSQLHVCGVGVWCPWEELAAPANRLLEKGVEIRWYCGRGYLQPMHDQFENICRPVFLECRTNTEAVQRFMDICEDPRARRLASLAVHDQNIIRSFSSDSPDETQSFWMDFIEASIGQRFKYQDTQAYLKAIRKLAAGQWDTHDEHLVAVFRRHGMKHVLKGRSKAMRKLRRRIKQSARTDEHVLITGESGVGKEFVAHLVHEGSERSMGPMIPVNCATFTGNVGLANSVLFGHMKGAFTGALNDREGAFVASDSGTLFLDEIGELPLEVQTKLLRVLEDGRVTPEGADRSQQKVDVRVVAATNRDLAELIRRNNFRADLYHRLDTLRIHVPPLREHAEDIPVIADHALENLEGKQAALSPEEKSLLMDYDWPGNVRQLIKILKRWIYLDISLTEALQQEVNLPRIESSDSHTTFRPSSVEQIRPIREIRNEYAHRALDLHEGNKTRAAEALGIAVNTLKSYLSEG